MADRNIEQDFGRYIDPQDMTERPLEPDEITNSIDEDTPVEEQADGSAVVSLGDDEDDERESKFDENLADGVIEESELSAVAIDLLDCIDRDKEARKRRDEQYAEGIKRTGLGNEAPGGATFTGASKAVHPVLAEACIDFAARAMKELFPPSGPVKTLIIGEATKSKVDRAERKKTYMNWQLTKQMKEYRSELEQMLTQVPLGGSQYLKIWPDTRYERPRAEFAPIDDVFIPFAATDFLCAQRKTHRQKITKATFLSRVASGLYREIGDDAGPAGMPEQSAAEQATDKIEGREDLTYDNDGLRTVYEVTADYVLKGDPLKAEKDQPSSYVITIDDSTRKVLAIYRNWEEEDEKREALEWMVEFPFIPWRGALSIGIPHIAGSMSGAMTGALRALLDSAHTNNFPGAIKLKGSRISGQTVSVQPGEIAEVEGPTQVDDIRKLVMPFPYNQPSPVLFELLQYMGDIVKGVINTAEEKIADATNQMPVGTALALIEQGSITFSAIHARLHAAQARVLAIIHRVNGRYMDDEVTVEELGELVVRREDFQGPMDIQPVSDPNIFSDAQRYAQNQAALQLANQFPQFFNMPELVKRAMQLLKYPAYSEVMQVPADAKELDAVTENVIARKPETTLKSYDDQDHMAHLQTHVQFMVSPIFCANPLMANPTLGKLIAHCAEHLIALYTQHAKAATEAVQVVQKLGADSAAAQGVHFSDQELAKQLAPIMGQLEQAMKLAQQFAPPPPPDPSVAAKQLEIEYFKQRDQAKAQLDQANVQLEQTKTQVAAQTDAQQLAADNARHTQEMQVAAHNAELASQSEQQQNQLTLFLSKMKEAAQTERDERQRQFDDEMTSREERMKLLIAQIGAKQALDLENLRKETAVLIQLLNHESTMAQNRAAAASESAGSSSTSGE